MQSPKRTILLIGGTGQIGSELERLLQPHTGVMVTTAGIDRGHPTLPWIYCDLKDATSIVQMLQEVKPTIVINAAAYTSVDAAEDHPDEAMAVNGRAPAIIAEELKKLNGILIHYSTEYVYNGSKTTPWIESDLVHPLNVYGKTKLEGDRAIQQIDIPYLILRTSWIYSPNGSNFVTKILTLAEQKTDLQIVSDQIGAPTSARVVAEVTYQIVLQAGNNPHNFFRNKQGIVHVACAGYVSRFQFAEKVLEIARSRGKKIKATTVNPITSDQYPQKARRPINSCLDCGLLMERFGIALPRWESALDESFPPGY